MRFWHPVVGRRESPNATYRWFAWYPVKDWRNDCWVWLEHVMRGVHSDASYLDRKHWRFKYEIIGERGADQSNEGAT